MFIIHGDEVDCIYCSIPGTHYCTARLEPSDQHGAANKTVEDLKICIQTLTDHFLDGEICWMEFYRLNTSLSKAFTKRIGEIEGNPHDYKES